MWSPSTNEVGATAYRSSASCVFWSPEFRTTRMEHTVMITKAQISAIKYLDHATIRMARVVWHSYLAYGELAPVSLAD